MTLFNIPIKRPNISEFAMASVLGFFCFIFAFIAAELPFEYALGLAFAMMSGGAMASVGIRWQRGPKETLLVIAFAMIDGVIGYGLGVAMRATLTLF